MKYSIPEEVKQTLLNDNDARWFNLGEFKIWINCPKTSRNKAYDIQVVKGKKSIFRYARKIERINTIINEIIKKWNSND